MAGRNTKLTPEVTRIICDAIRNGAFDYVAAQAAGISRVTFINWMNAAQEPDADPATVEFFNNVQAARADARQDAENRVYKEQPFNWLRYGPGRERPGEPGWTSESTVTVNTGDTPVVLKWADSNNAEETATD